MLNLLRAYRSYDPAARSALEILFLYPGFRAIVLHRLAHALHRARLPFFPRLISEVSRFLTGIDIHPGARIGKNVIIDHGMGVVIGETSVVGDDVIIFQGVTLGGARYDPVKRHPTVESHVVISAGAKILGNVTIGEGSRIGANSVVVQSVPPRSTVVGIPGRVLQGGVRAGQELSHDQILAPGGGTDR